MDEAGGGNAEVGKTKRKQTLKTTPKAQKSRKGRRMLLLLDRKLTGFESSVRKSQGLGKAVPREEVPASEGRVITMFDRVLNPGGRQIRAKVCG